MDPARLTTELERLMQRLEDETLALAEMAERAAEAEVALKVARSRALLRAEGAVALREAEAAVATEQEHLASRIAEARYYAQRELLASLRAQIDAVRTLNANVRSVT